MAVRQEVQHVGEFLPRKNRRECKSAWLVQGPGESFHPVGWAACCVASFASWSKGPERTPLSWGVTGRSKGARTGSALSLAIMPTRPLEKSPGHDDHDEHGQPAHHHASRPR